jgi:hypothetical protein
MIAEQPARSAIVGALHAEPAPPPLGEGGDNTPGSTPVPHFHARSAGIPPGPSSVGSFFAFFFGAESSFAACDGDTPFDTNSGAPETSVAKETEDRFGQKANW